MSNVMNWYRLLGCIVAENEAEFLYFYTLFNSDNNKTYGKGVWNMMKDGVKYKSEYQRRYRAKRRNK